MFYVSYPRWFYLLTFNLNLIQIMLFNKTHTRYLGSFCFYWLWRLKMWWVRLDPSFVTISRIVGLVLSSDSVFIIRFAWSVNKSFVINVLVTVDYDFLGNEWKLVFSSKRYGYLDEVRIWFKIRHWISISVKMNKLQALLVCLLYYTSFILSLLLERGNWRWVKMIFF